MEIQVYKFGGASIATPERMQQLLPVIEGAKSRLLVDVSALGKTTNALEEVVKFAIANERERAIAKIKEIEATHNNYAEQMVAGENLDVLKDKLNEFYTELH